MSKNLDPSEETDHSATTNLGSYFGSSTPTIFDEIASSNKNVPLNPSSKLNLKLDTRSKNIFESDSSFDEPSEYANINDSHRDAWIPSASTLKILRAVATSPVGQEHDRENLTMPGLVLAEDLSDPVKEAVTYFIGEEEAINRKVLSASDVTQVNTSIFSAFKLQKIFYHYLFFFFFFL